MRRRFVPACAAALVLLMTAAAPAGAQKSTADGLRELLERAGQSGATTTPSPSTPGAPAATTADPAAPVPDPAAAAVPPPAPDPSTPDPAAAAAPAATPATPGPPAPAQPPAGTSDADIAAASRGAGNGADTLPAVLVALGVVAFILLVAGMAWAVSRWLALDPRWLRRWRHACGEAAFRASGAAADFADWVRLGR